MPAVVAGKGPEPQSAAAPNQSAVRTGATVMAEPGLRDELKREVEAANAARPKRSGPTTPGTPPPPAGRSPASSAASLGGGFARPSPVPPRSSQAIRVSAVDNLGDPADLDELSPADQEAEACARAFAFALEQATGDGELPDRSMQAELEVTLRDCLGPFAARFEHIDVSSRVAAMMSELLGHGPLEDLLIDDGVREIFIHGPQRVVARFGTQPGVELELGFSCPQAVEAVVRRLCGSSFGFEHPVVDARTYDGHDVYAVHDSVAAGGPVVNIALRGAAEPTYSLGALAEKGMLTPSLASLLGGCITGGLNLAVFAGPGARAYPILAALAEAAPHHERQLVVRPGYEVGLLPVGAVVLEGQGLIGVDGASVMQALVRTALGLAPDRLLVHEVAGVEASDLFAALGRGLKGSVLTTRASSAERCITRLASLVGLFPDGSAQGARETFVAQSIDLMIGVSRFADGQTRITSVCEPILSPSGTPSIVELVRIDPQSGNWSHTGASPTFLADLVSRGIAVDFVGAP